jgi:hypothetical protein
MPIGIINADISVGNAGFFPGQPVYKTSVLMRRDAILGIEIEFWTMPFFQYALITMQTITPGGIKFVSNTLNVMEISCDIRKDGM